MVRSFCGFLFGDGVIVEDFVEVAFEGCDEEGVGRDVWEEGEDGDFAVEAKCEVEDLGEEFA